MTSATTGLQGWHDLVRQPSEEALRGLVAHDAVFHSPAMFAPQHGAEAVVSYLHAALDVLGRADFRYERTWEGPDSAVLEFRSTLAEREVHGVDIIEFDADGRIRDFTVMVRPLSALTTLMQAMQARLGLG